MELVAAFRRRQQRVIGQCRHPLPSSLTTGTTLRYKPGIITGGSGIVHECGTARGIGYYLEPLLLLGLYGKKPLTVALRGITNHPLDPSVDVFRSVTIPMLKKLGIEDLELKIVSRGAGPDGGGEVLLRVPNIKSMPPINYVDEGMVKRVRGIAHSMKVSPQNTNRMVDGARGVLNDFLADVYVFTDHMAGPQAGKSPGESGRCPGRPVSWGSLRRRVQQLVPPWRTRPYPCHYCRLWDHAGGRDHDGVLLVCGGRRRPLFGSDGPGGHWQGGGGGPPGGGPKGRGS